MVSLPMQEAFHMLFNTAALRKTKIAFNFGLSECERVETRE